jgi:glycosyltransferase involved in cell wall biosynthesis
MVAGVPIVATRVDGVPEAVISGERGGLLVPPGNPDATSQAAVRLIKDRDLAMKLALMGQAWALSRFDVRTMVTRIDELYQQLWSNHSGHHIRGVRAEV